MSLTITPTVSRKVWFYENASQSQPMDATIIKVHGDPDSGELGPLSLVNLSVRQPDSGTHRFIHAVQASEEPVDAPHYRWMPYQTGQAKAPDTSSLAEHVAVIERTLGIQAASPEGRLLVPDVHLEIAYLGARVDKIADYVGMPTDAELQAAQAWLDTGNQQGVSISDSAGVIVGDGNNALVTMGSGASIAAAGNATFENMTMSQEAIAAARPPEGGGVTTGAVPQTVDLAPPPATDEFVAPGASLFSDPSQTKQDAAAVAVGVALGFSPETAQEAVATTRQTIDAAAASGVSEDPAKDGTGVA